MTSSKLGERWGSTPARLGVLNLRHASAEQ